MVGNTEVGKSVPLVVVRDGKRKEMDITLTERPQNDVLASVPQRPEGWLGLRVDDIEESGENGVVVVGVDEGSPAARAGIRVGDVITEVYSRSVDNLRDYVEISETLKDRTEPIAFLIKRETTSQYVPVIPNKN
jgi:serine protease Do